jgi:hypothetical protein
MNRFQVGQCVFIVFSINKLLVNIVEKNLSAKKQVFKKTSPQIFCLIIIPREIQCHTNPAKTNLAIALAKRPNQKPPKKPLSAAQLAARERCKQKVIEAKKLREKHPDWPISKFMKEAILPPILFFEIIAQADQINMLLSLKCY